MEIFGLSMSPDTQCHQLSAQLRYRLGLLLDLGKERFPLTPHLIVIHPQLHSRIPYPMGWRLPHRPIGIAWSSVRRSPAAHRT
ncbi:MAG TPA: hypothetical protein VFH48_20215 [Chloroflexota bacterium]|nr:hypothetical protein [Chloroflexota bacterium]